MGINCLLLSIAGTPKILSDFIPDNGLAGLAAVLVKNGHSVKIVDYNAPELFTTIIPPGEQAALRKFADKVFLRKQTPSVWDMFGLRNIDGVLEKRKKHLWRHIADDISRRVDAEHIEMLGFKLWAGEGFSWCMNIGEYLKTRHPQLRIFAGGPHVDIFGQQILARAEFLDAVCFGEGEDTIRHLANFVSGREKLDNIPNILFRRGREIVRTGQQPIEDLNSLPLPIYSPDVYEGIESKLKMFVLDESRGCPNRCSFCIHPVKSGKRREKSAGRIVAEMKHYRAQYGVRLFRFAGSSTPPGLMTEVAGLIRATGLDVRYASFGSIREFSTQPDFALLKESGCRAIFFGVETVNEEILLKGMNRRVKKEAMEQVLCACRESGIFTVVSVIHPAPFETAGSRAETLEFLKRTRPDAVLVQFPGIYPGTPWFAEPEKYNFSLNKSTYFDLVMNYQIKSLFPPRYWKPLPYRVNGMSFRRFARETERFQRDLNAAGINTSISDEAYLLFSHSSYASPEEFLRMNRYFFYCGDAAALAREIAVINEKAGV